MILDWAGLFNTLNETTGKKSIGLAWDFIHEQGK